MSRPRRPESFPPATVAPLETSSIPGIRPDSPMPQFGRRPDSPMPQFGRRPDSPMPQFGRRPDTHIDSRWGREILDSREEQRRRHASQPDFPALWTTDPSSMGLTDELAEELAEEFNSLETSGGLVEDEDSHVSETENLQLTDGLGRCAQTLEEAKINLDNATRTTRAMNNLDTSIKLPVEEKTEAAAGSASGANNGTRVNMRDNSGSIEKLDAAGSRGPISVSMATDSATNASVQSANLREESLFSYLERPIMYIPPPHNPGRQNSTRRLTPSRPSMDPLQRLFLWGSRPQNLSSNPDGPNFTLPRHPSSSPTFTTPTNPTSRNSNPTPVNSRPTLNLQHLALRQRCNLNPGSTPSQNPSSQHNHSSSTILPTVNLNIRLNFNPNPTIPNGQNHEPREPRPDPSLRSAPSLSTLRLHQHQGMPLLTWSTFECRRWIFKFLVTEYGYHPMCAFRRAQKFRGAGSDLYLMPLSQWFIMTGYYLAALRIHEKLTQNVSTSHKTDSPKHEPVSGA
ncbi:hypothetical protein DSL72_009227 [Monilinia vaccinii-corymbosi]|uniref:Uncharacterized protein n=1 Tax=Monilinia vaccinii-corymbosi TaxID=61207 RepID=A0A8A3PQG5_9HELO|nr:hypothetical protein DSL72_009227 [Monilinia vaccinii-corymbosi]